jgi:small-conductance mechanosensitive channel
MSVPRAFRLLVAVAALFSAFPPPAAAQGVDPAVVGERLQRLAASVEAVEATQASQRRQIEELGSSLHRIREDLQSQGSQRPWAEDLKRQNEDLKRLAAAIEEVDRKRIADHKQVLEILADLRKAVAAAADAPSTRPPNRPAPDRTPKPESAEKWIEHVMEPGQSLSLVLRGFNEEAKKKGYQPLTVQQVMKFNRIADERRIPQGATLKLPLYPKAEKP